MYDMTPRKPQRQSMIVHKRCNESDITVQDSAIPRVSSREAKRPPESQAIHSFRLAM